MQNNWTSWKPNPAIPLFPEANQSIIAPEPKTPHRRKVLPVVAHSALFSYIDCSLTINREHIHGLRVKPLHTRRRADWSNRDDCCCVLRLASDSECASTVIHLIQAEFVPAYLHIRMCSNYAMHHWKNIVLVRSKVRLGCVKFKFTHENNFSRKFTVTALYSLVMHTHINNSNVSRKKLVASP